MFTSPRSARSWASPGCSRPSTGAASGWLTRGEAAPAAGPGRADRRDPDRGGDPARPAGFRARLHRLRGGRPVPGEDGLAILSPRGATIRRAGPAIVVPAYLMGQAGRSGALVTDVAHDRVLVVVPVRSGGRTVGFVALFRPMERLEYVLRTFWLTLVLIAVAALAAAVLIGLGLSRWAARPLAVLDSAARKLGDGDLSARAAAADCPAEFRRLANTFNTMAGRLETLVHDNRAVIEDVSHQLRTPLAALRLRLDLLAQESSESSAEFTGALGEVARLSRLVDGLLAVARAEN